jgi:hypothetical protein
MVPVHEWHLHQLRRSGSGHPSSGTHAGQGSCLGAVDVEGAMQPDSQPRHGPSAQLAQARDEHALLAALCLDFLRFCLAEGGSNGGGGGRSGDASDHDAEGACVLDGVDPPSARPLRPLDQFVAACGDGVAPW